MKEINLAHRSRKSGMNLLKEKFSVSQVEIKEKSGLSNKKKSPKTEVGRPM